MRIYKAPRCPCCREFPEVTQDGIEWEFACGCFLIFYTEGTPQQAMEKWICHLVSDLMDEGGIIYDQSSSGNH